MLNLFSTLLNIGFKTSVLIVGGTLTFTYLTKPSNESFNKTFTEGGGFMEKFAINAALDYVVKPTFDDYVFFKIATLPSNPSNSSNSKNAKFIGVANNWFATDNIKV